MKAFMNKIRTFMVKNNKMKKLKISGCIVIFVMMFAMLMPSVSGIKAYAEDNQTNKTYVKDDAGLLSDSEAASLEKLCEKTSRNCKTDIIIVTMRQGMTESQLESYLQNMIKSEGYGYDNSASSSAPDAIALGIDMQSRKFRISVSGNAKSDMTQKQMDGIVSSVQKKMKDSKYNAAFKAFAGGVEKYMNKSIVYRLTYALPVKLLIAAGVATVVILIMMYNAKAKMTVDSCTYTKDHKYDVRRREDVYINTTVVKHHIERNHGSGGSSRGGGGGNSGGGGSF